MRLIVGLLSLLIIAILGSHAFRSRWNPPLAIRRLFDSGLIFLAVGIAIGPAGINLITYNVLERLGPVVVICLGWIGFLFGAHFEYRRLRRIGLRIWTAAIGQSTIAIFLVMVFAYLFFKARFGQEDQRILIAAAVMILAATAGGTAPTSVFLLEGRPRFTGEMAQAMRFISVVDDLPGLLLFGLFFCFFPPHVDVNFSVGWGFLWLLTTVLLGMLLGFLIKSLMVLARSQQATLLVVLGAVSLASGLAAFAHFSPLIVCLVAGLTFANVSGQKESAYGILASSEHTIYVLFLVLVGCSWTFNLSHLAPLVLLYLGCRTLGKVLGSAGGSFLIGAPSGRMRLGGLGLLGQGGMAIAMAVSYSRVYPSSVSSLVLTALIFGVVLNEIIGPLLARIPFGPPPPEQRIRR